MLEDVKELRQFRKKYNQQMFQSGNDIFRKLEDLEAAAFQDGALSQKHKELIGLAVGISNACYG
jgi:alkylhydroperoxidase/carboxymuconolactone decarboxylase family protein YurZ